LKWGIWQVIKGGYASFFARVTKSKSASNVAPHNQQQLNNSNHGPVSKDLLFSNWPLMCLAGNYCDNDKGFTAPGRLSYQSIQMQVVSGMQDWDRSICFV